MNFPAEPRPGWGRMLDMPKERSGPTYRCPHCGEHILRLPDSHDFLVCNRCRARYMVMIDPQTQAVALVDQAAKSGPAPLGHGIVACCRGGSSLSWTVERGGVYAGEGPT